MRWTPRRSRIATVTAVTLLAGLAAVPPAAAKPISSELAFACVLPGNDGRTAHRVTAAVAAPAPARGAVGKAVRIGPVSVSLSLPSALTEPLLGPEPTGITGRAHIGVVAEQNGQNTDAGWPEIPVATAVADGSPQNILSGTLIVPALLPSAGGRISLKAESLSLRLDQGDGGSGSGKAIACEPVRSAIVDVPVDGTGTPPHAPGASPANQPQAAVDPELRCTATPPDWDVDDSLAEPLPEKEHEPPTITPPGLKCGRLVGYSNVRKLGGAAPFGAKVVGQVFRRNTRNQQPGHNWEAGHHYAGTYPVPATATMLGFGFMPTTVTARIEQDRAATVTAIYPFDATQPSLVPPGTNQYAGSRVKFRVDKVQVNGLTIDPGAECGNVGLIKLRAVAHLPRSATVVAGGPYLTPEDSLVNIPAFQGCGTGEDLSPLFTASVSGSGNRASLFQGVLCNPNDEAERCSEAPYRWAASPLGRSFTGNEGPLTVVNDKNQVTMACATMPTRLGIVPEIIGGRVGTASSSGVFGGCTGASGAEAVTTNGSITLSLIGASYDVKKKTAYFNRTLQSTFRFNFRVPRPGGTPVTCFITTGVTFDTSFDNTSHELIPRQVSGAVTAAAPAGPECSSRYVVGDPIRMTMPNWKFPEVTITGDPA